jgi:hypothetical protein
MENIESHAQLTKMKNGFPEESLFWPKTKQNNDCSKIP